MEMFLFTVLLLVSAVQYSSCERFNIVPSPDSPCPGEFTGEPCLTLQQYVANYSLRSSNITFEMQPGNHRLVFQLRMSYINLFTMRTNTSATVSCSQQLSEPFYFNRLQQIHVSGITFIGCRMNMQMQHLKETRLLTGHVAIVDPELLSMCCTLQCLSDNAMFLITG